LNKLIVFRYLRYFMKTGYHLNILSTLRVQPPSAFSVPLSRIPLIGGIQEAGLPAILSAEPDEASKDGGTVPLFGIP
jgi:hypothetical protein